LAFFGLAFQFLQAEVEFFGLWGEFFAAFGALAGRPGVEWRVRRLHARGEIDGVITYRDHFLPLVAAL
jgi:hypothetical protein